MADPKQFGKQVNEYLTWRGLTQMELAGQVYLSPSELSKRLNGSKPLTKEYVRSIVRALAKLDAISTKEQVAYLLRLMECDDFNQVDWASDPLNRLMSASPQSQYDPLTFTAIRSQYLDIVAKRYNVVTLPLGRTNDFPLQAVFQPLKLRQDALVAEDLSYEERRAFLDEPTRGENDPRRPSSRQEEPEVHERRRKAVTVSSGEEALERCPEGRLVILGNPGSGKTTMLKDFVRKAALQASTTNTNVTPIFISLPDLAESAPSQTLQRYLPIMLGQLGVDESYAHSIWEDIQRGHALVCLDGLDEVATEQRETIIDWINDLASRTGNRWVVGSRFSEYKSGQLKRGRFAEWELQPLTDVLRRELAQRLLPEIYKQLYDTNRFPRRLPSSFLKALDKHARAATWGKNPLLLSLAALVFVDTGTLPPSRAELYHQVIDAVLKTRLKDSLRRTTVYIVAAALALELHRQKRRTVTREILFRVLPEIRKRMEENWNTETLARDLINSGLFEVVAKETYGFWHQTYHEYLAAMDLAQNFMSQEVPVRKRAWALAWEMRRYSRWAEVLRLLVGVLVDKAQEAGVQQALSWLHALAALRNQPEGDVGDLGLALILRSLGETGEMKMLRRWKGKEWIRLEEEIADTWTQALFEAIHRGHGVRRERLLSLADDVCYFSPSVVSGIAKKLIADNARTSLPKHEAVLRVLGKLGKNAPVDYITGALDDQHEEVRSAAAHALAELGGNRSVRALVRAFKHTRATVREAAIQAAGEMREYDLLDHFLRGLRDHDWRVRRAAVEALGNLEDRAPVDQLAKGLRDEEVLVRAAAVEAAGRLGAEVAFDLLITALDDPYDSVRATAIEILGERTPVDRLIAEVDISKTQAFYSCAYIPALEVLARLEERFTAERFTQMGENESQELLDAMRGIYLHEFLPLIQEFQQKTPTEQVIEALYDTNKEHSLSAAYILGKRQEWELLEQFITSLSDSHGYLRAIAIQLLSRLGEQVPLALFTAAFSDAYSQSRLEAIRAVEMREDLFREEAIAVVTLLDDQDRRTCAAALRVLAQVSEQVPVDLILLEKLLQAAQSDYTSVARPARRCLENIGRRVTTNQFTMLFHHKEVSIRVAAIKILGRYASLGHLTEAFKDRSSEVRAVAIQSLGERREVPPLSLLIEALKDEEPRVYYTAIHLLEKIGAWEVLDGLDDEEGPLIQPQVKTKQSSEYLNEVKDLRAQSLMNKIDLYSLMRYFDDAPRDSSMKSEADAQMLNIQAEVWREQFSINQLIAKLNDEQSEERRMAILALGEDAPARQLLSALNDEDWQVRQAALQILKDRTPDECLLIALGDEYEMVQEVALQIIKKRGDRFPVVQLLEALHHRKGAMRASAIRALAEHVPIEKLKAALGDSEEEVRLAAIDVLRETHSEITGAIMLDLTRVATAQGPSEFLASAGKSFIIEVIATVTDAPKTFLGELTNLLDWPYWEVRMRAAEAFRKLRRDIPEEAILRLFTLRDNDDEVQTVRVAADDALAEILSLQDGLEEN